MFGLDLLGIARYGKVAAAEFPQGFALGAFSNVSGFGDALPQVKKIIDTGRCPRVRLHLYWSDNAGHKPDKDYLQKIEKEAKRVGQFFRAYAGRIDCRVSGFCEQPGSSDGAKVREVTMRHMPQGVTYVHSYAESLGGKPLANCVNEVHGSKHKVPSGRFDFGYDGENAFDTAVTDVKQKFALAETFYIWIPQNNGNRNLKREDTKPRPQRIFWPNSRLIDAQIYQCKDLSGSKIPSDHIYKPVSDQHTNPPTGKDCKPVYITPVKLKPKSIELRADNGQVIATAPYFGTYNDSKTKKLLGYRYYFPDWGYLLAEKARRIQGHIKCGVFADGKKIGVIVPATRGRTR